MLLRRKESWVSESLTRLLSGGGECEKAFYSSWVFRNVEGAFPVEEIAEGLGYGKLWSTCYPKSFCWSLFREWNIIQRKSRTYTYLISSPSTDTIIYLVPKGKFRVHPRLPSSSLSSTISTPHIPSLLSLPCLQFKSLCLPTFAAL
jgi:hypothetical protein